MCTGGGSNGVSYSRRDARHAARCRFLDRGPRPGGAGAARRPDGRTGTCGSGPAPGSAGQARGHRQEGTQARGGAGATLRRAGRRHGLQGRAATGQRAGYGQRDRAAGPGQQSLPGLRGSVPRGPWRQRDADLGPRPEHHEPRRDGHAVDDAAGAHRRPQRLPGLLRVRRLGLPAGQLRRDQADRGDSRARVRRLGRQRDDRRREHHHEGAARDAGHLDHDGLRHLQPRRRRADDGPRQRRHLLHEPDARQGHQRPLVVQGVGRVLRVGPVRAPGRDD